MTDQRFLKPIYLDHNASTPVLPEVLEAMLPYLSEHYGNPSSTHVYGRAMRDAVEQAREQLARLIDCHSREIYFTSGGTEANNLAIRGVAAANPGRQHIVTSVIEHPATSGPCAFLEGQGYQVDRVAVDEAGAVKLPDIRSVIGGNTLLVTVMHANSETGTLQAIGEIAGIAHASGALMHTDAAQSLGKVAVSVRREGVDLLSVAGHKLYAPQGVGALFVRSGTGIEPLLLGAGHERGLRPGTENVAAIAGLGRACAIAHRDLAKESLRITALRDHLWDRLNGQIPGLALNGHPVDRLPNTLNVRFPGVSGNALLAECPAVAASTGSACHEGKDSASAVILAMGIPLESAAGSVRLTLGRGTTKIHVDRAADELVGAWKRLL
jgi:cysteine desulfurase